MPLDQTRIIVQSAQGEYPVNFVTDASRIAALIDVTAETFVLTDVALQSIYADELKDLFGLPTYTIVADENSKTLAGVEGFIQWLLENNATRSAQIVAIGGGVIQDVATFTSHIYYRGIHWIFVPTTLLSQADSCIGAKCGINVPPLKNQLGVLHSPSQVVICSQFLKTLPDIEVDSGYGEIYKLSLTGDGQFFDELAHAVRTGGHRNPEILSMIRKSLESKRLVIEEDEYESDLRRILNYGHSFGHALEALTQNEVSHGLAVMWGMDLMNNLGIKWGITNPRRAAELRELLAANTHYVIDNLPTAEQLVSTLKRDKKVSGGLMHFAVMRDAGDIRIVPRALDEQLTKDVAEYLSGSPLFASR